MSNREEINAWMAARPRHYEQLFDDGSFEDGSIGHGKAEWDPAQLSLSALARNTTIECRVRLDEYPQMDQAALGVDAILEASRTSTFGDSHNLFDQMDDDSFGELAAATTRIITHWERACNRRKRRSPFEDMIVEDIMPEDIELTETQLVIMTGAALLVAATVAPDRSPYAIPKWTISAIKYYGPAFTEAFLTGEDVAEALGEDGASMSHYFTIGEKRGLLATSGQGLLHSMTKIAEKRMSLADINLAEQLGWPQERVDSVFTPAALRSLTYYRRDRPLIDTAKRIKHLYDEVLTPANIARELGVTPTVARQTFKPSTIHNIVTSNPDGDPLTRLRDILDLTGELTNSYELSYELAVWIASYLPKQAHDRARLIAAEQAHIPRGVSPRLWAALVAKYPRPNDPRRLTQAVEAASYWNFLNAISMDEKPESSRPLTERLPDWELTPEQLLFDPDGIEKMRRAVELLINGAKLSEDEADTLLDYHSTGETEPPDQIQALMSRVRNSGEGFDLTADNSLAAKNDHTNGLEPIRSKYIR